MDISYHILCIHFSVDGHLGCFYLFAIIYNNTVVKLVYQFWCERKFATLEHVLRNGISLNVLRECQIVFQRVASLFYTPTAELSYEG